MLKKIIVISLLGFILGCAIETKPAHISSEKDQHPAAAPSSSPIVNTVLAIRNTTPIELFRVYIYNNNGSIVGFGSVAGYSKTVYREIDSGESSILMLPNPRESCQTTIFKEHTFIPGSYVFDAVSGIVEIE